MEYLVSVRCLDLPSAVRLAIAVSREVGSIVEIETIHEGQVIAKQEIFAGEGGGN